MEEAELSVRVLVVSSDAAERSRATAALRHRDGVEVEEATDARQAHRAVNSSDFDVLVIDGDMRPEGGQSVLYEIRAAAEYWGWKAPPTIILMDREQDRWLSAWAGAQEALVKPVDSFDLAHRVIELAGATGGEVAVASPSDVASPVEGDRPSELGS